MANAKRKPRTASRSKDAVTLLKADHKQVKTWFAQFEKASRSHKSALVKQICRALRAHTTIEEEIFYPAFLEQSEKVDVHHEAEVEHASAKTLIAQIEKMDAADEYFDAKVTVLSEMIKHHVNEEEQPGGMFAAAKKAGMDLKALGQRLAERKLQVEASLANGERISQSEAQRAMDSLVVTSEGGPGSSPSEQL